MASAPSAPTPRRANVLRNRTVPALDDQTSPPRSPERREARARVITGAALQRTHPLGREVRDRNRSEISGAAGQPAELLRQFPRTARRDALRQPHAETLVTLTEERQQRLVERGVPLEMFQGGTRDEPNRRGYRNLLGARPDHWRNLRGFDARRGAFHLRNHAQQLDIGNRDRGPGLERNQADGAQLACAVENRQTLNQVSRRIVGERLELRLERHAAHRQALPLRHLPGDRRGEQVAVEPAANRLHLEAQSSRVGVIDIQIATFEILDCDQQVARGEHRLKNLRGLQRILAALAGTPLCRCAGAAEPSLARRLHSLS